MKKILATAILAALVFTGVSCDDPDKKAAQPFIPPDETVLPVEAFGTVKTADIREIFLPFPAVIEKLHVTEYQKVKAGDILISVDLAEYKSRIAEKELEIQELHEKIVKAQQVYQSELDHLNGSSHPDMKKLLYELANAKDELEKEEQSLAVKESLYDAGSIALEELTSFREQADSRAKNIKSLELSIEALKYQKQKDLENFREALDQDKNRYEKLTLELGDMNSKLQAGFMKDHNIICEINNGMISEIVYMPGAYVNPANKVLRMLDLDSLIIEAGVDEQFISKVKMNAKVHIFPEADRTHTYTGKVTFISAGANTMNGETTVPVTISVDQPDDFLLPNFNVEVVIEVEAKAEARGK